MLKTTTASTEYFASIEDHDQLASEMTEKIRVWREWIEGRGLISLWTKKLTNYYGISANGNSSQSITAGGAEGELNLIKVNDLHNLIQNQLVMVTSQRPAGVARAVNSDTTSLKASRIGTAIAEYYMSQGNFESKFVSATEIALLCDESFIDLFWDKAAGDPIAVDHETGMPEMSGDCVLRTHAPWNVARDPGLTIEQQKWYILSFKINKFDAAASYPKFSDSIISESTDGLPELAFNNIPDGSDSIFAHLLVHDRTASVPEGRYSLMIGQKVVLDSKLPYKDFPVERMAPSDVIDGPIGYSSANDILALEEVSDALHSVIVTNQIKFGGQCIVGPEGANINHTDFGKGVRYFELPPDMVDKLRSLQLTQTAPEVFNYLNMINSKKEQAVGVNSVVRGQPEGQLAGASGSALALIQTQAISFNSGTQRSYFKLLSGSMTKLIGILRVYADTPRVAKIVGKSKAQGLKEFKYTGDDLESISSIVYEMVNPISQSFGGRLTLAQDLLKAGQIKSPKQYINVVQTGQTDTLTEDDEADAMLILEENEWLTEGKPFQAVIVQQHADHIKSHNSQITLQMQQTDPEAVGRILAHIQEHINLWQQASATNPGILMATGQQPLMPPPPPQGAPGMPPGGPPQLPPPGHGGPPPTGAPHLGQMVGNGQAPVVQKAGEVAHPNLPNIAGSKNKPTVPGVTDQGM
jgi:hypothetical protein